MLRAVIQGCQDYYDQIPPDMVPKVARSAFYTFTVTFLYTNTESSNYNIGTPLFAAGAAALASVIYALTTPFFNMAFEDNRILLHREIVKQFVVTGLTSIVLAYMTTGKVNLVSINILGSLSCNIILGIFEMIPTFIDWLGDSRGANDARNDLKSWGLDAVPGSSSVFVNFGSWET